MYSETNPRRISFVDLVYLKQTRGTQVERITSGLRRLGIVCMKQLKMVRSGML